MAGQASKQKLTILIPNGIIMALIGILVAITPLAAEIRGSQLVMDLVAGGVLLVGGSVSIYAGVCKARRPAFDHAPGDEDSSAIQ